MTSVSKARHFLGMFLALGALTLSGEAHAGGADADRETARGLLEEGKARRDRNDWQGALEAFKAADTLMHVPTTGLFVAKAHLALGQLVEAREAAIHVTHLPVEPKESKPFTEARGAASAMSDELGPRIPSLHIVLRGGEHAAPSVKVDDGAVPLEALVLPRKVNPGHHVVVVAFEHASKREEVDLAERDAKEVTIDVAALEAANARATPVAAAPPPPPVEEKKSKRSPLVYAGFGAAVVGVAVGTVAGIVTLSKRSTIDAECRDSRCPPSAYGDLDAAQTTATISTVGFVVAGVGAVVGVIGLVMGKSAPPPTATATTGAILSPRIFVTGNGIGGSF